MSQSQQSNSSLAGPTTRVQNLPTSNISRTQVLSQQEPQTLRLRGQHATNGRSVQWADDVVDNEGLGRKSSKVCCIYHKPKAVGESSDESSSSSSSSSDSDSDSKGAVDLDRRRRPVASRKEGKKGEEDGHDHDAECEHDHGDSGSRRRRRGNRRERKPSPNAYEKIPTMQCSEEGILKKP